MTLQTHLTRKENDTRKREDGDDYIRKQMNQRLARVSEYCQRWNWRTNDSLISDVWKNQLFVDDINKLIFCSVPKSATSSWKRVLVSAIRANQSDSSQTAVEIMQTIGPKVAVHMAESERYLHKYVKLNSTHQRYVLENYRKFLFVRNPYERLLSAYMDKLLTSNNSHYTRMSRIIANRYPEHGSADTTGRCTFRQFLQFATSTTYHDRHWRRYIDICNPCRLQPDFIGKFESLKPEANFLLTELGIGKGLHFSGNEFYTGKRASALLRDFYSKIPKRLLRDVYEAYKVDFEMFDYSLPKELIDYS